VYSLSQRQGKMNLWNRYLHPQPQTYHVQMEAVTAFVLAGGKSSRMGRDKALLELRGKPLLQRAIELARTAAHDVRIVGDPEKYACFGRVVADIHTNRGPLGGIHAALANTATELNLILATDLPSIQPGFLKHLITTAESTDALVTVPRVDEYFEPLCAVYRKNFAEIAHTALSQGRNKVDALFAETNTRAVTRHEIVRAGFSTSMFRNLNTPDDLAQVESDL